MSEDEELKRRIAQLAGRINQHKHQESTTPPSYGGNYSSWTPQRGSPYGVRRGGRYPPSGYRNRTLVWNNGNTGTEQDDTADMNGDTPMQSDSVTSPPRFVTKRDRHVQLINTSVYDQISQQRAKDISETLAGRRQARDAKETARLGHHFTNIPAGTDQINTRGPLQEIDVNGIRFRVQDGGSKLIRTSDDPNTIRLVPKRTKIAGVTFFRSKHGNLYRSGLVKTKTKKWVGKDMRELEELTSSRPKAKSSELCPTFTSTGTCSRGPNCRFTHDPNKVAICKDYLAKGTCHLGDGCDLSHEPTPNRVPACIHFLRGNCTNDDCRYAHVKVNASAPVCRQFAVLGYCDKGNTCDERHVTECPDYANKGACRNQKCRLPHVDRAGQLRKVAANAQPTTTTNDDSSSDLSSDEEDNSDDIDSDEDILIQGVDGAGQDLTGNRDFISL